MGNGSPLRVPTVSSTTVDESQECRVSLEYRLNNITKLNYQFYVSPEQINISVPSRLGIYQSISGTTYVDNLGEGTSAITLQGSTGLTLGGKKSIGFGYASYQLLRYLLTIYHDDCKAGKTQQTKLIINISFPDAPDFGMWEVTPRELNLSRNSSDPLSFRYQLSLICLTRNLIDLSTTPEMYAYLNKINDKFPATISTEHAVPPEEAAAVQEASGTPSNSYTIPAAEEASSSSPNTIAGIWYKFFGRSVLSYNFVVRELRAVNDFSLIGDDQELAEGLVVIIPSFSVGVQTAVE